MSRLYALKYGNKWFVSATRLSNYARVTGEGCSLPAAYLDYLRVVDKEEKHNKACVAEEARIVELIKRKATKTELCPPPEPVKKTGLFGKLVRYITK